MRLDTDAKYNSYRRSVVFLQHIALPEQSLEDLRIESNVHGP